MQKKKVSGIFFFFFFFFFETEDNSLYGERKLSHLLMGRNIRI